jgi:hypothetical protein
MKIHVRLFASLDKNVSQGRTLDDLPRQEIKPFFVNEQSRERLLPVILPFD